jgi:hypothetical protein
MAHNQLGVTPEGIIDIDGGFTEDGERYGVMASIDGVGVRMPGNPEDYPTLLLTAAEAHELGTMLRRMARKVREAHEVEDRSSSGE